MNTCRSVALHSVLKSSYISESALVLGIASDETQIQRKTLKLVGVDAASQYREAKYCPCSTSLGTGDIMALPSGVTKAR